jgi:nucleoside-diphosphate-sugar epimerase
MLPHGGHSLLHVWSDPHFEFVRGDICDSAVVEASLAGIDAVVHLAAIVGDPACARQPDLATAVNLEASTRLLDASRTARVSRFIFASTCSNYGKMRDPDALVDETSELQPVSLYARTKVAVEKALLECDTGDMCTTPLRFATVFGVSPRMRFDLTVNEFTFEMLEKHRLVVFGEQFWRPYVHVRDIASAIAAVLAAPRAEVDHQVFNVGSTAQNYQKRQLVEMIKPYAPDAVIESVHRTEDPRDYKVSFDKIESQLDFRTAFSVRDGIEEIARLFQGRVITNFQEGCYRN